MKVLLVGASGESGRCGVNDYIQCLSSALRAEGATVTLASAATGAWPADWGLAGLAESFRYLHECDADLLHVHYPSRDYGSCLLPWLLPLLARRARLPVVVTLHEPISLLRIYRLLAVLLSGAQLITVRPNLRDLMGPVQRRLLAGRKLHYLRSASTLPVSRLSAGQVSALRKDLGCTGRLLVFFGFLYPAKGVHRLVNVPLRDGDVLAVAGETPDASYAEELKDAFARSGKSEQLRFLGPLPAVEASDLIAAADALLLPFEGGGGDWNTSIHAGIQNGTFVVTTSTQRSGYDPEEDVFYVTPGDSASIAAALAKRFAGELLPSQQGSEGRGRWGQLACEHLAIYHDWLRGAR